MKQIRVPELMDAADVDPVEHRRALAGLRRINRLSRAAGTMLGPIRSYVTDQNLKSIRLLDVASGGGDVPIAIASSLVDAGLKIELTMFDQSDVGLIPAVQRAKDLGVDAKMELGDAIEALPRNAYDLVTCSLFLHHLDRGQCVRLLSNMKRACSGMIVISDLVRSRGGLLAATAGCHLLSRSPLVHHDGPASVRAAWTPGELYDIARNAGLEGAVIRRCFPWRMVFRWQA